jgi:hypothetical protein
VHEIRTPDHHLSARSKLDQSEAIFICSFMQAVFVSRWLVNYFPTDFRVCVSHYNLHVVSRTGTVRPLKFFIDLVLGHIIAIICWCVNVNEGVVEESVFHIQHAEDFINWGEG